MRPILCAILGLLLLVPVAPVQQSQANGGTSVEALAAKKKKKKRRRLLPSQKVVEKRVAIV